MEDVGRRGKGMSPRRSEETIMLSISKTFLKRKLIFSEKGSSFLDPEWLFLVLSALVNIKTLQYMIVGELSEPINNYISSICHVPND